MQVDSENCSDASRAERNEPPLANTSLQRGDCQDVSAPTALAALCRCEKTAEAVTNMCVSAWHPAEAGC